MPPHRRQAAPLIPAGAYTIDKDTAAPDQEERDALSVWALRAESSEHAHCVCGVKGCEKWLATYGSHTKTISFSDNAISQDAEGLKINGTVWEKRELKTSDNTVVGYYYRLPAGDYYLDDRPRSGGRLYRHRHRDSLPLSERSQHPDHR